VSELIVRSRWLTRPARPSGLLRLAITRRRRPLQACFTTVLNGTVRGFATGLLLQGWGNRVNRIHAYANQGSGIRVGPSSIVTDSEVA
jgi:hypothetical protein